MFAELAQHVVVERDAGRHQLGQFRPGLSSTRTSLSLVVRSIRAVRLMDSCPTLVAAITAPGSEAIADRGRKKCGRLAWSSGGDAQPAWQTNVADQNSGVQQSLPHGSPVSEASKQYEVRVTIGNPQTHFPCTRRQFDLAELSGRRRQRAAPLSAPGHRVRQLA